MILKANHFKDIDILDFLTPEDRDKFLNYVKQNPGKTYWKGYYVDKLIEKYYSNRFHSFMSSVMYLNNYEDAIKEYNSICNVMWSIISMMSDKIEVADYFISKNIFKLIKEIDEMYWFLKQQGAISIE